MTATNKTFMSRIMLLAIVLVVLVIAAIVTLAGTTSGPRSVGMRSSSGTLYDGSAQLAAGQIPFSYQSYIRPHVTVVPDPLGGNFNVMKYAIADSDRPYSGASNPRGDFETSAFFTNGSDLYSSMKFLEPAGFPALKSSGFFQIMEIYGPPHGGSPTIGIDLFPGANGRPVVSLQRDASHGYDRPWTSPTLDTGWHTIYVHSIMSTSESGGLVEIWFDGVKQGSWHYRTLGPSNGGGPNILNINQYRKAGAYPGVVTTYQAAAKVGTTLASVQDGGGTTTSTTTTSTTSTTPSLTAAFTGPATSKIGQAVTFDSSSSTGSPVSYSWTDAAAKNVVLGTGANLTFTFHYAGTKKITLTETDASGAKSVVEHDLVVS